jgi:hypothetical protein
MWWLMTALVVGEVLLLAVNVTTGQALTGNWLNNAVSAVVFAAVSRTIALQHRGHSTGRIFGAAGLRRSAGRRPAHQDPC